MATPTTLPASFTAGAVLTAAQMNNLRGAFRILQVVQGTTSTGATSGTASWVDTTLTATITPSATSSKILVYTNTLCFSDNSATQGAIKIVRNSTDIITNQGIAVSSTGSVSSGFSLTFLDSPATTSAVTYKTQQQRYSGSGAFYTQLNNSTAVIILMEVSA